jgi:hypothetical protein
MLRIRLRNPVQAGLPGTQRMAASPDGFEFFDFVVLVERRGTV